MRTRQRPRHCARGGAAPSRRSGDPGRIGEAGRGDTRLDTSALGAGPADYRCLALASHARAPMSGPAQLDGYRSAWQHKPVLQLVYDDFSERIAAACIPGLTIEIGGGIGNLKQRMSNVVRAGVQFAPWLDCVC